MYGKSPGTELTRATGYAGSPALDPPGCKGAPHSGVVRYHSLLMGR